MLLILFILFLILAIAMLIATIFTEKFILAVLAIPALILSVFLYFRWDEGKHPEQYKKTSSNFNPDARLIVNGSKVGLILGIASLCVGLLVLIFVFISPLIF